MKAIVAAVLLGASVGAFSQDIIIDSDGNQYTADAGYKAVFVPADTPDSVLTVRSIKVITPGAPPTNQPGVRPRRPPTLNGEVLDCTVYADDPRCDRLCPTNDYGWDLNCPDAKSGRQRELVVGPG
jgi:hypothetical protein